tara:strand:- start:53396 stop:53635 length:240 start_codon:yes stop_codon:yes gene_type:complete
VTRLNRQLVHEHPEPLRRGFGADMRGAMQQRSQWLAEQQLAEGKGALPAIDVLCCKHSSAVNSIRVIANVEQETGLAHH